MNYRREQARKVRDVANQVAYNRIHPTHANNGEEFLYRTKDGTKPTHIANFTKGLPHVEDGFLEDPDDYHRFVLGIQSGDSKDFERTRLGPPGFEMKKDLPSSEGGFADDRTGLWHSQMAKTTLPNDGIRGAEVRAWESAGAGRTFDLQGPDAQAVTMPPAPRLGSDELVAEMAEVYLMALLRDVPFLHFKDNASPSAKVQDAVAILQKMRFFGEMVMKNLTDDEKQRQRRRLILSAQTLFRGLAPGDDVGPYLSQFLLIGNLGINGKDVRANEIKNGNISYGALRISQKVRTALPGLDYITTFEQWLDVQNGADLRGLEKYADETAIGEGGTGLPNYRFIATPRDLATYVHYDALYEAYLNACILLLAMKAPFDPGLPFQQSDKIDKQQGFAQFGGPHILSLVTEVATRALKAVRYQKFNVHRRARPEAVGGLIHLYKTNPGDARLEPLQSLVDALTDEGLMFDEKQFLEAIAAHNEVQNDNPDRENDAGAKEASYLLPMAFPEGSPMHPAYGAGHATVAGACVTVLKAYFDHGYDLVQALGSAWEPNANGSALIPVAGTESLTVEGELNKLGSNIAIGRDWAGVHYYTDYIESFKLGEQIALGILEEQKLLYSENFTMTVPLLDGTCVRV